MAAAQRTAVQLLKSYFASAHKGYCFISTPMFHVTADRVIVQLYYYPAKLSKSLTLGRGPSTAMAGGLSGVTENVNNLCTAISQLYSKEGNAAVPVELRVVRLHQPYLNSYILAQYLATNASIYGFTRLRQSLLSAIPLGLKNGRQISGGLPGLPSSAILGVKVQLSGLLTTQRNAPRKTVSTVSAGTFHGSNTTLDYGTSTTKSSLGAYTVKV